MKKKKVKENNYYICPTCEEKQTTFREWQTCSVAYEKTYDTGDYIDNEQDLIEGGDFESYACPNCTADLPNEIIDTKLS